MEVLKMEKYSEWMQEEINTEIQSYINYIVSDLKMRYEGEVSIDRLQEYISIAVDNADVNVYE